MSLVSMSVQHNTNLAEAKTRLEMAVAEVKTKFTAVVRAEEWSADRTAVKLSGPGVVIDLRVDDSHVHATGDIPMLNTLLGSPVGKALSAGLRNILGKHFKALPSASPKGK